MPALLLSVRFYDGRYHGAGDWPPAPARLFQALVAGAAKGAELSDTDKAALAWLETLDAPVIAAPAARTGQAFRNYVPNNDLDKLGGDPRRISEIRTPKNIRPHIFNAEIPLLFIWAFNDGTPGENHTRAVCKIAERLYQLGRGVDMAWAWAEILDVDEIKTRLARHGGVVHRPSKDGTGKALLCPRERSLVSLKKRYNAKRFTYVKQGRKVQPIFSQPSKPRFAKVAYATPPHHFLFEIRTATSDESFVPWPSERVTELVLKVRDKAASRLKEALPEETAKKEAGTVDRVLIGRNATEADKAVRVRILPLPSIGHNHADRAIRRILVEISPNCPLRADDIAWAFSGLVETNPTTGEILWNLVRTGERGMLDHYGIDDNERQGFRVWRTVTPAALPVTRTGRGTAGAKRVAGEAKAARAVMQALRHAEVAAQVESVRVQREPFDHNGAWAEAFAMPERFGARSLHHVEIAFAQAVRGPLVIGNGRYLGLGLMAPQKDISPDTLVFSVTSEINIVTADTAPLLYAVRRALMALSRDDNGHVPRLFSGHELNGAPARSGGHEHVFLAADDADGDGRIDRLIVAAPWVVDRSRRAPKRTDRTCFEGVVSSLERVRAGRLGVVTLSPAVQPAPGDVFIGPSRLWESRTPYRPTRHTQRGKDPAAAVIQDVILECGRRGIPRPEVEMLDLKTGPKSGGVAARLCLRFVTAVDGPVMLGRDSHRGGGLFGAVG